MKKFQVGLFCVGLIACLGWWLKSSRETMSSQVLTVQSAEKRAEPAPIPISNLSSPQILSESSQTPLASGSNLDSTLLSLTLSGKLDPQAIEDYAKKSGLTLQRQTHGHPKTGQRLELTWGSEPTTTAVFDVMDQQKFQLSAVRSIYSANFSLSDLKEQLKAAVDRPIDREDENMIVFAADEHGLVVWLAKNEDGTYKLASEFVSPGHESGEH